MKQPDEEWIDREGRDGNGAALWIVAAFLSALVVIGLFLLWIAFTPIKAQEVTLSLAPPVKKGDRLGPSYEPVLRKTVKLEI